MGIEGYGSLLNLERGWRGAGDCGKLGQKFEGTAENVVAASTKREMKGDYKPLY